MKKMQKIVFWGVMVTTLSVFYGCSNYFDASVRDFVQDMLDGDTINYKEKQKMLNEIEESAHFIKLGERQDVRSIVEKYLPIGISKEQAKEKLRQMHTKYSEYENTIVTVRQYKSQIRATNFVIRVELNFSNSNYLDNINAYYLYQQ